MTPTDIALAFILMSEPAVASTTQEAVSAPVTAPVTAPTVPDGCAGITGYSPACVTVVPVEWVSFGNARPVTASGANFGSDGPSHKQFYTMPPAGVLVHNMRMSGAGVVGRVSFGPSGSIGGVSLRMWVSTSPDGPMVNGCGYVGYVEAVFSVSTDGSLACNLSPGGTYYLNQAFCASTPTDQYCSDPSATTPNNGARLVMAVDYY
jgi:hypothetical protein